MKTSMISVHVELEVPMKQTLMELCKTSGSTVSWHVRQALFGYFKTRGLSVGTPKRIPRGRPGK